MFAMRWSGENPIPDVLEEIRKSVSGPVRGDLATRMLYSTDASIYQIPPLGVVFPRSLEEISAVLSITSKHGVPVLARGAGSSLAGQAIGSALILDCSRYLTRILDVDPDAGTAVVEPGVVLDNLNRAVAKHNLAFGPDPASSERATMGGSIANNATGAHSISHGMAADHVRAMDVVLSDGSLAHFSEIEVGEARRRAAGEGIEAAIYRAALRIRTEDSQMVRENWPKVWRRASGYNLNYLLPWSPSKPPFWSEEDLAYPPLAPNSINLSHLVAGSEGTLAVIHQVEVCLTPKPANQLLVVMAFGSIAEACDAVPAILEHQPSAVELVPEDLIMLARSVPAYAHQVSWVDQLSMDGKLPAALLVVEFAGAKMQDLQERARRLDSSGIGVGSVRAESSQEQQQVWAVRKVGLGLLMSRAGDEKPWPFIEDLAVPVENLGDFIREMERIFTLHNTRASIYAHASAGCLHIRPILSLKSSKGIERVGTIAAEAVRLALRMGGVASGEHGDGISRSVWLEEAFGEGVVGLFREVKEAADPGWRLNPGKIVSHSHNETSPEITSNLRFGINYRANPWVPVLDFQAQSGLQGAIEQCNGAGVCRKDQGVMCPSFQATKDEKHSTRGRANMLRAMISGQFPDNLTAEREVYEALDLCLACKGCKAECPSAVDMAKLKYEFLNHYYSKRRRRSRDYLFAYIDRVARLGWPFRVAANALLRSDVGRWAGARLGVTEKRSVPLLASQSCTERLRIANKKRPKRYVGPSEPQKKEIVLLLLDAFTEYFYPEAGIAAVRTLESAQCEVHVLPLLGAGRTLISKGFLKPAQQHLQRLVDAIESVDPSGSMAVVGVEPSEIYTLREEMLEVLPGDKRAVRVANRAWMVDEYLLRPDAEGNLRYQRIRERGSNPGGWGTSSGGGDENHQQVLLHGHCYQKSRPPASDGYPAGVAATLEILRLAGYEASVIEAGCCGMAGAFGYESEHYVVSKQVGELSLLPAVRSAPEGVIVSASGVSCQAQIQDETGRKTVHPVELLASRC